ncbi:MAG TPA: outer membrane beta-barrel protein [Nitrospiraceae bacterium]|nr:outer membrane beta-barrel protein [Nitrospiraceae bacterium]
MPTRRNGLILWLVLAVLVSTYPANAQLVPLNPYLTQQARFTNVGYQIYPNPFGMYIPLIEIGNIRTGPLLIHPHFGMAQSYTDNVFRTDTLYGGRRSDTYTTLAPGLQLQLPFMGRHRLVFDYRSNIERYSNESSQNVADQTIGTNLVFNLRGGLTLSFLQELKTGHDYRGSATATGINEPNKFYNTIFGAEVLYAKQAFLRARYKYIRWEFIGENAGPRDGISFGDINTRNRVENYYAIAAGARVAPKTYLFLEEWIGTHTYEINKPLDSTDYTTAAGVRWEATGKTVGEVTVGWQKKTYSNPSGIRGTGEFSGLYLNGNLYWTPLERTQVIFNLFRRTNETVVGGTRFFVSTGAGVDIRHAFTKKWRATLQFLYDHDSYSDPIFADNKSLTRKDNYLTMGPGIWYQIQPWLGARATYFYTERLSNFDSVQYNANVLMVSIQGQF